TYTGVAEAQGAGDPPLILILRPPRAHLSIGASQSVAADLDTAECAARGVEVIQRPLGGGSVWVDPGQTVVCVVFPAGSHPGRPAAVFDACLGPMLRVCTHFGLAARRVGEQDIWADGRKILGSGAATIGTSLVFATSILRRFDADAFAAVVRCPSPAFRDWLAEALADGMGDWSRAGAEPEDAALLPVLREAFAQAFGWSLVEGGLAGTEISAVEAARAELAEPPDGGTRRHVRYGIKVNQWRYVLEDAGQAPSLRLDVDAGRVRRIASDDAELSARLQACAGEPVARYRLEERLVQGGMSDEAARAVLDRLLRMTQDIPLAGEPA
ncbi:MAG TPA: lipoate--protein ligase family protein, partial [Thioalkalivibrio sp.]|nr:lipoate--protein ligase family protein [Thioalkalivibrio sp.]